MEWLDLRSLFTACLSKFGLEQLIPNVADVRFAWRYHRNLTAALYRPSEVFKKFSFAQLLDPCDDCACLKVQRFSKFLDSLTVNETSSYAKAQIHVRTMDVKIVQHTGLREAIGMGLNHIPLKPTDIAVSIATALDAFSQFTQILDLENSGLPLIEATEWIRTSCLERLKAASKSNKSGLRFSGHDLMQLSAVKNEIGWITARLYCAGLDKATNNACFICIRHIRLMALERLSGPEFSPCKTDATWITPSHILDQVAKEITDLVPQISIPFLALPYLMATYKQHKNKYRWLTNAFNTVYSNMAHLLTIATMQVLEQLKSWAGVTLAGYSRFLRCHTSIFWMINSSVEAALNLPVYLHDIFVADVTRCYESIPLDGPDNIMDAIAHIVKIGFQHAKSKHRTAVPNIWIRTDSSGQAVRASWETCQPSYGTWFSIDESLLIRLHQWLVSNCYIALGDRVWKQRLGIPMGFACSPLWCNLYLMHYEILFIQRLARLGRNDLLEKFQNAFRYIDDLCWLNVGNPMEFLSPQQERTSDNPFWIYPLNVLEIKPEVSQYSSSDPSRGICANFMNLQICIVDDNSGSYTTQKFDKRRTLPFKYTQYIKFKSNRPIKQSYNIAVSQTVPILYISSSVEAAFKEIMLLILTLKANGFLESRLRQIIRQFLCSNSFPGLKFDSQTLIDMLR